MIFHIIKKTSYSSLGLFCYPIIRFAFKDVDILQVDPTLCRADRMVGQVLGAVGHLPSIYTELEVSYYLLRRLLGVRTEGTYCNFFCVKYLTNILQY